MTFYNNSKQNGFENLYFSWQTVKTPMKQVAKWATIPLLGASILFGDTIINDAQRQITLNLKQ